jgi:hypothetical protein
LQAQRSDESRDMGTKEMSLKRGVFFLAAAAVIAAGIAYLTYRRQPAIGSRPAEPVRQATTADIASTVHLYFGDKESDYLTAETRSVTHAPGPEALGRAIVEALLDGPRTDRNGTIPKQAELKAFYITSDATAYVDLSADLAVAHPGGAHSEQMTVYSIVNSLVLNIPEIERVKILIAGTEATTLAGHIALQRPLAANMLIVR